MRSLSAWIAVALFAAAPAAASPEAGAAPETGPMGHLERATFTTQMQDREPTDTISTVPNDRSRVYYFTEVMGMMGETITHRWAYHGQVMAEVSFDVRGPRWRVYSSKNLEPTWLGDWTVTVVDATGRVLSADTLKVTAVHPPAAPAP